MKQIAYKTISHSKGKKAKHNFPDDFITSYIDASLLPSLDGWHVADEITFSALLKNNKPKLKKFRADKMKKNKIEREAKQAQPIVAPPVPTLIDLQKQLTDLQSKQEALAKIINDKINVGENE